MTIYSGDLFVVSKDPSNIMSTLTSKYKFKLKGTSSISYYIRGYFRRDKKSTFYFVPRKYIEKIKDCYVNIFNTKSKFTIISHIEKMRLKNINLLKWLFNGLCI